MGVFCGGGRDDSWFKVASTILEPCFKVAPGMHQGGWIYGGWLYYYSLKDLRLVSEIFYLRGLVIKDWAAVSCCRVLVV
jgi:hypothetical protein